MAEADLVETAAGAAGEKRCVAMSLAMPFYPIERAWTSEALLLAPNVDRAAYLAALSREALGAAPDFADCRVPALWVGGGIAGHMADDALGALLRSLRQSFDLTCEDGTPAEITLAVHPGMVAASTTDACRIGHITRLVFDYATSSPAEWQELGRFMGPDAMEITRTVLGPKNRLDLAFELLVGIPGQTERSARASVEDVVALGAAHVRLKPFALDPACKLAAERAKQTEHWRSHQLHRIADDAGRAQMLAIMGERLRAEGFAEYLPGEWALPGHESRYLRMRAANSELLGFGLGARTLFQGVEARNTCDLATYLRYSDDPEHCIVETRRVE